MRELGLTAVLDGMAGDARRAGSEMAGHLPTLYMLAHQGSFGEVVELGVNRGWSTTALFAGVRAAGRKLVSYDFNPGFAGSLAKNLGVEKGDPILASWEFRCKDSVKAAEDFKDGSVSVWFLDTLHTLDLTRRELEAWLPKMHPEGIMCGHDYLLESYRDGRVKIVCGVKQAVDEFAARHADRFVLQVMPHDLGLFILRPRS